DGRAPRRVRAPLCADPPMGRLATRTINDIAAVVQKISHGVMRKLHQLGYLEPSFAAVVATGYDPLRVNAAELAQTLAASVQQRIAFGERAGQQVRRIGSGFGHEDEAPTLTGPRCASVHGFSLHANTQVPAHRRDQLERLIRYTALGAVSLERLAQDANGDLIHVHPSVVGWDHGDSTLAVGTLREAGGIGAPTAGPPGALWRLSGAAQPPAWGDYPDLTPARDGRRDDGHQGPSLELGATAQARVCSRHGALSLVSAAGLADHRGHYAGRGDPENPPASEAGGGPTPHCSNACPPRSLCVVLGLSVPRTSPTRLRPLPWGGTTPPSPAPPDVSPHTASGWEDLAVRRQRLPRASRGCPCATSLAVAASCALARLSLRQSSLFQRLFQPPQQASACARALTTVTSCVCISLSPLSVLTPQR